MRKTSIKTLSLALSLLLAITVLFSLSLSVWAETEAALGDLNADGFVNGGDVTILEAVLNGSQTPTADLSFYDISGNKMVDSEDLTVLKNMVDPNEPALADKLADGTTDDLLELVSTVTGGQLQRAVVRGGGAKTSDCPQGSSTRALELNGGTMTVLFAQPQNWSDKAALELDTLWVSGDRAVTVLLLGADGETILGTPIVVTAAENGWSRISLPLTGILAKERAKIGGIVVTVANDAHVYMDNLALIVAEEAEDVLTRDDLENALVEMAWNWYFKGSAYQYDSASLNSLEQHLCEPLCGYAGGKSRLTLFPTLEDATSHSSVYTVCSGFAYDMYLTALGYPILGSKYNSLTMTFWRNSSYYPGNVRDAEGAYDMTVLRWHDMGQGTIYNDYDTEFSNYYKDGDGNIVFHNWHDRDAVKAFFATDENGIPLNFRPGDIIVSDNPGHTIIYIGNGMVMDVNGSKKVLDTWVASGGGKYNMTTGADLPEVEGCVSYRTFDDYFHTPNGATPAQTWLERRIDSYPEDGSGKPLYNEDGTPKTDKNGNQIYEHNSIVVLRPLNLLTLKDEDSDPSNDKLNPDYVLQTGPLKYQLEHDKTHEVKTSGYGIDETTETRLQYPGMNIDRTVNIKPYGTAVKDETITYSVKITNNSTDTNYTSFRQASGVAGYAGQDYEDLWVVEHIPANTELVAIPEGATLVGDTLRWNIDVLAGQTVELTYTVTVTGEIGDKIVSGGGWVNNISSNTITNIIGGKKLSTDHQDAMSADGITTATGTDLAEQIYKNATGQDLQLPAVQKLMDIFFSEYTYETPYGYYLYYNSSGITGYMYKLNAKSPTIEDKLYYDMLVPNYYGGMWCYTDEYNGEPRINELREEYLEVGDILVYMDLTPQPTITNSKGEKVTDYTVKVANKEVVGYTVLVYLGNGSFASVDQNGALSTRTDAIAYTEAFKHDLFVCLRPSQVYEDLSDGIPTYTVKWENAEGNVVETDEDVPYRVVPTFDGAEPTKEGCTFAGWSPAIRPATGDITYKPVFIARDLSASMLTEEELKILANITPADVKAGISPDLTSQLANVAPWVYNQANINYTAYNADYGLESTYNTAKNRLFNLKGITWTLRPSSDSKYDEAYASMLVPNAYGGNFVNDAPVFDMGYLQVGDLFCGMHTYYKDANKTSAGNVYTTYLYQGKGENGEGKFLLLDKDSAVFTLDEVLNSTYTHTDGRVYGWGCYYVIRPERYNKATRDLTLRKLTDAEMYELEQITDTTGLSGPNLSAAGPWIYQQARITYSSTVGGLKSTYRAANEFFSGGTSSGYWAIKTPATAYATMLVPNSYGGRDMQDKPTFDINYLQVGDLFCGMYSYVDNQNEYRTYLYQGKGENGEGKFLLMNSSSADTFTLQEVLESTFTYDGVDYGWGCYYVIRPENYNSAKRDISLRALTDAEKYALSKLTYGSSNRWIHTLLPDIYKAVGINVDMTGDYKLSQEQTLYQLFEKINGVHVPRNANNDVMRYFQKMMVPCYGGSLFAEDAQLTLTDAVANKVLQIGDAVSGFYVNTYTSNGTETKKNSNFGAVYQGNGKFLVVYYVWDEAKSAQTVKNVSMTAAEIDALDFNYYYTLRPENLATVSDGDTFTVTWVDEDGSVLATEKNVPLYTLPSHDDPAKDPDAQYTYTFAGWTPLTTSVNRDVTYTAVYTATPIYTVTWLNDDGTELKVDSVPYGTVPTYDGTPTKANPAEGYTYTFAGWDKEVVAVTGDATYTATYSHTREIIAHELTEAEKQAISDLDITSSMCNASDAPSTIITNVYKQIGIDLEKSALYQTIDFMTLRNTLIRSSDHEALSKPSATKYAETFKFYRPMLVDEFYGGTGFAEGKAGTKAISAENLQVGDIFCAMVLANTTVNDAYTFGSNYSTFVLVYQDDGQFGGCMNVVQEGETSRAKIWSGATLSDIQTLADANAFSFYLVLRPSQLATPYTVTWLNDDGTLLKTDTVPFGIVPAYDGTPAKANPADGYTYTFEGWTPEAVVTTGDATYTATYSYIRDLTAHKLTDEEMAALAAITPDMVKAAITSKDLASTNLDKAAPWIYKQANIDCSTQLNTANRIYQVRGLLFYMTDGMKVKLEGGTGYDANYGPMLVTNAYGGTAMNEAYKPTFDLDCLQVGDIFCGMFTYRAAGATKDTNEYFTYLYQGKGENGEGKFLLMGADSGVYTCDQVLKRTCTYDGANWSSFYVLRPEEYGKPGARDIALRNLTDAEKYRISKIADTAITGYDSGHLHTIVPLAFSKANITVNFHGKSASQSWNLLFHMPSGSSYYEPKPASTDAVTKDFQTMFTGIYGGSLHETDVKLSESELQIGDVFVGRIQHGETNKYWSGIYQGKNADGEDCFLMFYWDMSGYYIEVMKVSDIENTTNYPFKFYMILRPDNLAN